MIGTPSRTASVALAIALLIVSGAVLSGCGWLPGGVGATPNPPNGNEQMPGPSYVHITGDPAVATTRLVFGYVLPDGAVSPVTDVTEAGATIEVDRTSQPGTHQLVVNGGRCAVAYTLEAERITHVVVHLDSTGCRVTVSGVLDAQDATPPPS